MERLPNRYVFLQKLVHTGRLDPDHQRSLLASTDELDFYERLWQLMDGDTVERFDRFMHVMCRRAEVPVDTPHYNVYKAIATSCYLI